MRIDITGTIVAVLLTYFALGFPRLIKMGALEHAWVGFAALFACGVVLSYLGPRRIASYAVGSFLAAMSWYVVPAALAEPSSWDVVLGLMRLHALQSALASALVTAGAFAATAAGHRRPFE